MLDSTNQVPSTFDEALILHQTGKLAEAEAAYLQILAEQPDHAGVLHLLGVVRHQQGRHEVALGLLSRAVELVPDKAVYRNNRGAVLFSLGRHAQALAEFQIAIALRPQYADAWANAGMAQAAQGEAETAEASFRRALHVQPCHRDASTRLAALLAGNGRDAESRQFLQAVLAAEPCGEFHAALGDLLLGAGTTEQAAEQYRLAINSKPGDALAHFNLGNAYEELHLADEARYSFARAAQLRPEKRLWRLRAELCGSVVFENAKEIEEYCGRVENAVEEWISYQPSLPAPLPKREGREDEIERTPHVDQHYASVRCEGSHHAGRDEYGSADGKKSGRQTPSAVRPAVLAAGSCGSREHPAVGTGPVPATLAETSLDEILEAGVFPSFALAYHGRSPRRLKEQFAAMYEPCFRNELPPTGSGRHDRKRIGILVTRRHEGMFLQSMRGIIEQLDDERFEPVILCSRAIVKTLQTRIRREGLRFVPFGDSLRGAIEQVREAACDLIYYWEVGTDAMNYFLPFARLAPVQCTGWATMTSGVPAVDWFFSSALIESPGSQEQYTERLWQSRTLFRYQDRAPATLPASRGEFGLPEDRRLYLCFQNPLKLHPDFDPLLDGILQADPQALVVLLADRFGRVARLLKDRFARHIPRAVERIIFLPPQSFDNYCRLLQLADDLFECGLDGLPQIGQLGQFVFHCPSDLLQFGHGLLDAIKESLIVFSTAFSGTQGRSVFQAFVVIGHPPLGGDIQVSDGDGGRGGRTYLWRATTGPPAALVVLDLRFQVSHGPMFVGTLIAEFLHAFRIFLRFIHVHQHVYMRDAQVMPELLQIFPRLESFREPASLPQRGGRVFRSFVA